MVELEFKSNLPDSISPSTSALPHMRRGPEQNCYGHITESGLNGVAWILLFTLMYDSYLFLEKNKAIGLEKKKISAEVEKLIEDFSSNKQKISELEKFVNKNYTNIIISFKADFPNLKEADYLLFLYTSLGFSICAIALFLKEDKLDAVYNRKARLKTKIRKLNPEQADNYLKILG